METLHALRVCTVVTTGCCVIGFRGHAMRAKHVMPLATHGMVGRCSSVWYQRNVAVQYIQDTIYMHVRWCGGAMMEQ